MMKRCRSVESGSHTWHKCVRLISGAPVESITNNPARRRSSAVHDAIETMLEEEQEDARRSREAGADFFASYGSSRKKGVNCA